jgi:hypothetical protein
MCAGYALAIDMTARGLQNEAKNKGLPWSVAKGYDTFCPVSRFIAKEELPHPEDTTLWLKVDDELRQNGSTKDMIFSYTRCPPHCAVARADVCRVMCVVCVCFPGFLSWCRTSAAS